MKTLLIICAAALLLLTGCGSVCHVVDISNNDRYSYRTACWENDDEENAAARARYYVWGARTQYPTNVCHRIEVIMYDRGSNISQTNVLKRARYWISGTKE